MRFNRSGDPGHNRRHCAGAAKTETLATRTSLPGGTVPAVPIHGAAQRRRADHREMRCKALLPIEGNARRVSGPCGRGPERCGSIPAVGARTGHSIVISRRPSIVPARGPVSCAIPTVYVPGFLSGPRHENPHRPPHPYSRSVETTSAPLESVIVKWGLASSRPPDEVSRFENRMYTSPSTPVIRGSMYAVSALANRV
jgi:hypothetical protein